MAVKSVFIVGSGLMGAGIAQVCAQAKIQVFMTDISQDILSRALKNISWSVNKFVEKRKVTESLEAILSRIKIDSDLDAGREADLVIEAVFEKLDLKQETLRKLDEICRPETLLASNTSAIPITELGAVTKRAEKVLGLHFFNPVPMMEVVEVIRGVRTSEEAMQAGVNFVKAIGKEPIRVESDVPGFLLNRINLVGYVEAIRLLEQGIGTVADIDKGVRMAFGRRMGPFETGDLAGLDVSCGALTAIYEESKDIRYYPPPTLETQGKGW